MPHHPYLVTRDGMVRDRVTTLVVGHVQLDPEDGRWRHADPDGVWRPVHAGYRTRAKAAATVWHRYCNREA